MTITRLFFYAALATCITQVSMAHAQHSPESAPAAASSGAPAAQAASAKAASQVHAPPAHVATKVSPATGKGDSHPAKARDSYTLSHPTHRLDSYQNAVTPPPVATDR